MGECKLCGDKEANLAKSHIIPKSLYGDAISGAGGIARLVSNTEGHFPERSPIGVYDQSILCISCEESLSPWDDYANEIFIEGRPDDAFVLNGEPLAGKYEEFDLHKLKMFFLTLLWRMQVTTHRMFGAIQLGPYQERIKQAILEQCPDSVPEVDVVISKFKIDYTAFLGPSQLRIDGVNGYRVAFEKYLCWVKVDSRPFPEPFSAMAISKGSPMHILYREFDDSPEKRAMIQTLRANIK